MNSEKVKEILGRLHCKLLGDRKNEINHEEINCVGEVITLINELESENERLSRENTIRQNLLNELREENGRLYDDIHKKGMQGLKKENAELKDRIDELEKEKTCVWEEWTDGDHSIWCCSNCKEDFCFMEGNVYENNYGYCPHCGAKITALKELKEDDIDETLKEFINKGDEEQ